MSTYVGFIIDNLFKETHHLPLLNVSKHSAQDIVMMEKKLPFFLSKKAASTKEELSYLHDSHQIEQRGLYRNVSFLPFTVSLGRKILSKNDEIIGYSDVSMQQKLSAYRSVLHKYFRMSPTKNPALYASLGDVINDYDWGYMGMVPVKQISKLSLYQVDEYIDVLSQVELSGRKYGTTYLKSTDFVI